MKPEGRYEATALQAAARTTKNGNEYIEIMLGTDDGCRLYYKGFMGTDSQSERTGKALRICGWNGNDEFSLPGNVKVEAVVQHEEYEGKTYERVPFINALTPSASADRARAMAAKLRGQQTAREEPPPPSDDDSLPF